MKTSESVDNSAEQDTYADRILDAARELFVRHGLRRTSLAQIADQAGVAPATLYRRFANREALLTALVIREADQVFVAVDAAVEEIDEPERALVASFLVFVRALRDHDLLQELLTLDRELVLRMLTTEGGGFLAVGRDYLARHLMRAQEQGANLTAEPPVLAEIFIRFAHSLILTADTILPLDDEPKLSELAQHTFARLAFAPSASS